MRLTLRTLIPVFLLTLSLIGISTTAFACIPQPTQEALLASGLRDLTAPEGITAWRGRVYVATMNGASSAQNPLSRIFVFDAQGHVLSVLGNHPGEEKIADGSINGLIIDHHTGDLLVAANTEGTVLRITHPDSYHPHVQVYARIPNTPTTPSGPEDMVLDARGNLLLSDSNQGLIWQISPAGHVEKFIGPGARYSDAGLFASAIPGLAPNGLAFSPDERTLYVANTWQDSVIAFDYDPTRGTLRGDGNPRLFARNFNPDLEEPAPAPFDAMQIGQVGASASTWLNGPDGLATAANGHIFIACSNGDNVSELDDAGHFIRTWGSSIVTSRGLLDMPASVTFDGDSVLVTSMSLFIGTHYGVVRLRVGELGAFGNGNL